VKHPSISTPAPTERDLISLHARAHNAAATALHALRNGSSAQHIRKAMISSRRALAALGQISAAGKGGAS
jgi:hypothetical protein